MKRILLLFSLASIVTLQTFAQQNVGISETTPASKLSVKGNLAVGSGYSATAAPADGAIIQGRVGIGTAAPAAVNLHVLGDEGFLASGNYGAGAAINLGAGTRMLWYPQKAAFRAGDVNAAQWNDANIGSYSAAFGGSTRASGAYSFAAGENNIAAGSGASSLGSSNSSTADFSTTLGNSNTATGDYSSAIGFGNLSKSYGEVAIGLFGADYTPASASSFNAADRIFSVGIGTNAGARANALTILKNGRVGIGTTTPDSKSILDITSTSQGVYIPRMSTVDRANITGLGATHKGLLIYNTDVNRTQHWNGSAWEDVGAGAGGPPTGAAGGDLTGTYPNPTIAPGAVNGGTGGDIADGTITTADLATPAVNATNQIFNTLPVGNGGTGTSSVPANGQILIGNGTNYNVANIGAGAGVSVTNGSGSITIANTGVTSITSASPLTTNTSATGNITVNLTGTVPVGNLPDATTTTKGIVQLAGDLTGTATSPQIAADAVGATEIAASAVGTSEIADGTVANADLATMAANTIKGNNTASPASPTDIAVGTNTVLGRVAGNIVAGQVVTGQIADANVTTAKIADANVTYAKIQNVSATNQLLGRRSSGAGPVEEIGLANGLSIVSNNLTVSPSGIGGWTTTGNASTSASAYADGAAQANNFIGTTDNQPIEIYTNSSSTKDKTDIKLYTSTSPTQAITAPADIMHIRRNGETGVTYPLSASFALGKYNNTISSETEMAIKLGNGNVYTPDVTVMTMRGNGNVGIGTTAPGSKLHIEVPADKNDNPADNGIYVYNSGNAGDNDDAIITARVNGANAGDPFFSMDVNGVIGWSMGLDNSDGDKFKIANTWNDPGTATRLTIDGSGNVGIGTTVPRGTLDINGNFYGNGFFAVPGFSDASASFDVSGLTFGNLLQSDDSWTVSGTGGAMSRRRMERANVLVLEAEVNLAAGADFYMGFVDAASTNYSYTQGSSNLLRIPASGAVQGFENNSLQGSSLSTTTVGAWVPVRVVLKGSGAGYFVQISNVWKFIGQTSNNSGRTVRVFIGTATSNQVSIRNLQTYKGNLDNDNPNFAILNQNSSDQIANMRISGTAQASVFQFPAPAGDPSPIITARTVPTGQGAANEKTELILFHSNDPANGAGVDQITLRAPGLSFQTYDNAAVGDINNNAGYNERMYITPAGNVGIGTTSPAALLEVSSSSSNGTKVNFINTFTGTNVGGDVGLELRSLGFNSASTVLNYIDFTQASTSVSGAGTPNYDNRIQSRPGDLTLFTSTLNTGIGALQITKPGNIIIQSLNTSTAVANISNSGNGPVFANSSGQLLKFNGTPTGYSCYDVGINRVCAHYNSTARTWPNSESYCNTMSGGSICFYVQLRKACAAGFGLSTNTAWLADHPGDDAFMTTNGNDCSNFDGGTANGISGGGNNRGTYCCIEFTKF